MLEEKRWLHWSSASGLGVKYFLVSPDVQGVLHIQAEVAVGSNGVANWRVWGSNSHRCANHSEGMRLAEQATKEWGGSEFPKKASTTTGSCVGSITE